MFEIKHFDELKNFIFLIDFENGCQNWSPQKIKKFPLCERK